MQARTILRHEASGVKLVGAYGRGGRAKLEDPRYQAAELASSGNISAALQNQQLTVGERKPKRKVDVADIFIDGGERPLIAVSFRPQMRLNLGVRGQADSGIPPKLVRSVKSAFPDATLSARLAEGVNA